MTKKPTTKTRTPKTPQKESPAAPPPSLLKSFETFAADAKQLPKEKVLPLKSDVNLIFANVQHGVQSVLPHKARLATELPKLDLEQLRTLPQLAEALLYAHSESVRMSQPAKRAELDAKLTELQHLREALLLQAEVFATLGILPAARVAQIRSGSGLFDAAQDGVALSDLYAEYRGQVAGKHPFSDVQLARIAELGHALMKIITPDGARTASSEAATQAMELRDRIYSLLAIRHAELRKAGFYLFGDEVDARVPPLGARQGKPKPQAPEPPPAPPA
jgi:hypothetical protein